MDSFPSANVSCIFKQEPCSSQSWPSLQNPQHLLSLFGDLDGSHMSWCSSEANLNASPSADKLCSNKFQKYGRMLVARLSFSYVCCFAQFYETTIVYFVRQFAFCQQTEKNEYVKDRQNSHENYPSAKPVKNWLSDYVTAHLKLHRLKIHFIIFVTWLSCLFFFVHGLRLGHLSCVNLKHCSRKTLQIMIRLLL